MRADAKSVQVENGWCTRFYRELHEPARVRREALISRDAAIAKSGLTAAKSVELVHEAIYANVRKPGAVGDNAMDFDAVLDHSELVYVVIGERGEAVHVDPYSGAVRKRIARRPHFHR